ncbi:putative fimbrial outer membrane usher protein SthC [Kluyvera cryocrescens]|uniref:Putative fimbrial outer membrane usher protein SthC n=1 Tax=Kluyvera cryocrescens TaxID=580 RepID=A0A485A1Z0_KLUCR|nr:putative fimbrial outer membrane usher protein SthC [Kluyvera cryocrescens]
MVQFLQATSKNTNLDQSALSSISVGYNNSWQGITYGLNYTYSLNQDDDESDNNSGHNESQFSLNVSIPFDKFLPGSYVNYSLNNTHHGATTHNVGISGTALEDNRLNWGIQGRVFQR